jgi:hypothetical protein
MKKLRGLVRRALGIGSLSKRRSWWKHIGCSAEHRSRFFGTHPSQGSKNEITGVIFTQTATWIGNHPGLEIHKMIRDIVDR